MIIFLLITAITALSVFAIERGEKQREHARLQAISQAVGSALERRGSSNAAYLRAGAALFSTVERVDERIFRRFVNELRLDTEYRGASGVGWAEAVRPEGANEYLQRLGNYFPSGLGIYPAYDGTRKWITPVTFLEPRTARNRAALGFDMYSEPARRAAMQEAERTVRPTASAPIELLLPTANGAAKGFMIYMPVFESNEIESTAIRRPLRGFVYSPFDAQQFLDSVLQSETLGKSGVRLYDSQVAPENLLAEVAPERSTGNVISRPLTIANRTMYLELESALSGTLSQLSMATLIFGLLVASLLMVVARLLSQQALEDRASLEWLREQNSIRNSLTRELNHRVKNTLANVLSIIALTRRRAENLDEFVDGIDGRIRALSATHDLLTQSEWGTTPIADVVATELAPYNGSGEVLSVSGPPVELAPGDALSLGLAIHELATNAAKYGALGHAGGRVSVSWTREDGVVRIVWQESGGPPVPTQRKRGFGTDLIEKIVAHELDNPVELDFAPEGVRCVITVPIRVPSDFAIRASR
ncbi:CHASE domain-containing protein [Allopontixanthobacter sp.]|uniref:CHASE domain-containing protein n=1 Tax=Allopontixanthobacter sp. TaxID=2906452 RepID=UPI002AB962E6|nr:CHASE domain-containing protein [Allopontixanthobacter sp.]MDZ4307617.1 CHASE domain-containing protein [Allopontixanthobacter sp.]